MEAFIRALFQPHNGCPDSFWALYGYWSNYIFMEWTNTIFIPFMSSISLCWARVSSTLSRPELWYIPLSTWKYMVPFRKKLLSRLLVSGLCLWPHRAFCSNQRISACKKGKKKKKSIWSAFVKWLALMCSWVVNQPPINSKKETSLLQQREWQKCAVLWVRPNAPGSSHLTQTGTKEPIVLPAALDSRTGRSSK